MDKLFLNIVPIGIVSGGQRFANTRRSITNTDIFIFRTGITKLSKSFILFGLNESFIFIHDDTSLVLTWEFLLYLPFVWLLGYHPEHCGCLAILFLNFFSVYSWRKQYPLGLR